MKPEDRDISTLRHIVEYCKECIAEYDFAVEKSNETPQ